MSVLNKTTVVLCNTKRGTCCPVVEIFPETQEVTITDDFGGKVRMNMDQFGLIKDISLEASKTPDKEG